jgi:hypothetical protein
MATSPPEGALVRAHDAIARRAWREAYEQLASADRETPLAASDLEALALAARLIGKDAEGVDSWTRAHQARLAEGDVAGAAKDAF